MNEQNIPQQMGPIQNNNNIWILIMAMIITALVVGGSVYAIQNSKLNSTEKSLQKQISVLQNQINQFQQIQQTVDGSQNKENEQTIVTSTTQQTETIISSNWKTYTNTIYGFDLTFNDLWKNYWVKETPQNNTIAFCLPTQSAKWPGDFCPLTIRAIAVDKWEQYQKDTYPKTPTYIDENASFVFVYSTGQDIPEDADPSIMQDIKNVIKTFKFTETFEYKQ